jgi:cyclophilin family peptidyl-prolyl cis-trans isomerase
VAFNVSGTDGSNAAFTGTVIVQLFEDLAPGTTARIEELVASGFYNGLDFHRILDGFVAQAGQNTNMTLDDEFSTLLTFNSPGLLAMASTSDSDSADAQFFITAIDSAGTTNPIPLAEMPQFLNFRDTIFGQLVSGFDTFAKMMSTRCGRQPEHPRRHGQFRRQQTGK